VVSLLVQPDGKIVVGGSFTSLGGQRRENLGRLYPDGSLDMGFNPGSRMSTLGTAVLTMALQADGRILVGGMFTTLAGEPRDRIGRLNPDGSLDSTFNPRADGSVSCLALQPDGKTLVGGRFTTLGGQAHKGIGRLKPDGLVDPTFNSVADGGVSCLALQTDGKVLVGGTYTMLGGQPRQGLGRLNQDGSADLTFDPLLGYLYDAPSVATLSVQADGRVLVGGLFTTLGGVPRSSIARLNPDGTLDSTFNTALGGYEPSASALAIQADGKILVGGNFRTLGGQPRLGLGRLNNTDAASQSLSCGGPTVTWRRGGSTPEVWRTTFEHSPNGVDWTFLGVGSRVQDGWELTGVSLAPSGTLRARGHITGGEHNGSGWFVESHDGYPVVVAQPESRTNDGGATAIFRVVAGGGEPLSYHWFKDGVPLTDDAHIGGAVGRSLTVNGVLKTDEGSYRVLVNNVFGSVLSEPATLTVLDPFVAVPPVGTRKRVGESVVFTVIPGGTPPFSYQWYQDNMPLPGATGPDLSLKSLSGMEAGSYTVRISGVQGSVISSPVPLTISNWPTVDAFNPGASSEVYSLALQTDGKIVVGGAFRTLGGQWQNYIGRLDATGTLDSTFNPVANGAVVAVALQTDRKTIVAGNFTTLGGQTRNHIGRLDPDGTLDRTFDPGANGLVCSLAVQQDGGVVVGGHFTTLGGQTRNRIGRLNADGTLDPTFDPGADGNVYCLAVQQDGGILVGGNFTVLGGQTRNRIGRLNPNGTPDPTFDAETSRAVYCLAVQADGRILVGGSFSDFNGVGRHNIARLNLDGTLDPTFDPGTTVDNVHTLALQSDGAILVGGSGGETRDCIGRLTPDGTLDPRFCPEASSDYSHDVSCLALQEDGAVLVGGSFSALGGEPRSGIGRVANTGAALQTLTDDGSTITWSRGGTTPEVHSVSFEHSPDGMNWRHLGEGTRIMGGWELRGVTVPPGGTLRARGRVVAGRNNGSSWLAEVYLGAPVWITQPASQNRDVGETVTFHALASGGAQPLTYQWYHENVLLAEEAGTSLTRQDLQHADAGQYTVQVVDAQGRVASAMALLTVGGGPLLCATPVAARLAISGEVDNWTFFGRDGESYSVVVETGGANVLSPQLQHAEVILLASSEAVLESASNPVPGETVVLAGVPITADGSYRVQVRAPADWGTATGNYRLTLWRVTPRDAPLMLNEATVGVIDSPYSLHHWLFSGLAGQQMRLNLINSSGPAVAFTLAASGGSDFSQVLHDRDLISLPHNGAYSLTVSSADGAHGIAYALQMSETTQTPLAVGETFTGEFTGSAQAVAFCVAVTDGGPLRISLTSSGSGNRTELYASRSLPPTRQTFEFSCASGPGASKDLLIPSAPAGTLYVLVYADQISDPTPFTLRVTSAEVLLAGLQPERQANNVEFQMTLTGAGFEGDTTVELLDESSIVVGTATSAAVNSFTHLTATFPPDVGPPGTYSVRVSQPDGDSALLQNAFQLLSPGKPKLVTRLVMPDLVGRHAVATIYIEYANEGNASMIAPLLLLKSNDPDGSDRPILTLERARVIQNYWSASLPPGAANRVFVLASGAQPGLLNPGERIRVPVYYLGLQQPWNVGDRQVEMEIRYWTGDSPSPMDWEERKEELRPPDLDPLVWSEVYARLTEGMDTAGDYLQRLASNARTLAGLGVSVSDFAHLWQYELQKVQGFARYAPIPVLDWAVDSSVTSPGLPLELVRRFSPDLRARSTTGWFGRGWYTPWQARLAVEDAGDVVKLIGEAGAIRMFTRDRRSSSFFSGPGDSATLTALESGRYELRASDGTLTCFRTDGRVDYVQDPHGNRISAVWNTLGRPTALTHTSGASITLTYNASGFVETATDSAGRSTGYTYSGSYLTDVTMDDGTETTYTYETAGTRAQRHALRSVSRGGTTRHYAYDDLGRVAATFLGEGDQRTEFAYQPDGEIHTKTAEGVTRMSFDHNGRRRKVVDPLGRVWTYDYDDALDVREMVEPTGESLRLKWCDCGSPSSITDQLGGTTIRSFEHPWKRMTSLTDARGNLTQYVYDEGGNLSQTIYADNSVERFADYTPEGLAQTYTNRRGQSIAYRYTSSGQLERRTLPDGSYSDFAYDARGNLTSAEEYSADGTTKLTSYYYDYPTSGDRLRRVTYPNGHWVEFFYDRFGRRERLVDSTGQDLSYEYDGAARLTRLRDADHNVIVQYHYDSAGRLSRVTKGNGTYTTYLYDSADQLRVLTNYAPDDRLNSRFEYTYDRRGRRTAMATVDGDWTYAYDATGQLSHARFVARNAEVPDQDLEYHYDAVGNRTFTVSNGLRTDYKVNSLNQYTGVGGLVLDYDLDGNLVSDGTHRYEYDPLKRLVSVTGPDSVSKYEYDAFGTRRFEIVNGDEQTFLVDPFEWGNVIARLRDADVHARYIHGLGLVRTERDGRAYYCDYDGIGSVVGHSQEGGITASQLSYDPFGMQLGPGLPEDDFGFVGQYGIMRSQGELLLVRRRFMAPRLGRFVSEDFVKAVANDRNVYCYAENNPVSFIDINGLWSYEAGGFIGFIGGVGGTVSGGKEGIRICGIVGGGLGASAGFGTSTSTPGSDWEYGGTVQGATPVIGGGVSYGNEGWSGAVSGGLGAGFIGGAYACTPVLWCLWCDPPEEDDLPPPDDPGDEGDQGDEETSESDDPNEKLSGGGVGSANWVSEQAVIPYRVKFENLGPGSVDASGKVYLAFATAPAQEVAIGDHLSPNLDWASFELTEIGFGDVLMAVPSRSQHFTASVSVTCCGDPFKVHVEAGIQTATGVVYANFRSVDPVTSLPPPVQVGFLPPEDGTGRGMGYVSFLVKPRANLPTGTEIRNVALIEFDRQATIATDQVDPQNPAKGVDLAKQALVTIDAEGPVSTVKPLPETVTTTAFALEWEGTDPNGGSGVAGYSIHVSDNDGPWEVWLASMADRQGVFRGQRGHTYRFFSVARDHVGHVEATPTEAQASTTISLSAPNSPPQPSDDLVGTTKNQPVEVAVAKLLANDTDPDGNPLTLGLPSAASSQGGGVALETDIVRYTPPTDYVGDDTFLYRVSDGQGGEASANVLVDIREGPSPNLNIISIERSATGAVSLKLIGLPGLHYSIQFSEDLAGWIDLAEVTAGLNGEIDFVDQRPVMPPAGYYRLVYP